MNKIDIIAVSAFLLPIPRLLPQAPHVERSPLVPVGGMVDLACFIQISRGQSPNDLQVWWTRNGSTIVSTEKEVQYTADGQLCIL